MEAILADVAVSMSEFKKNPAAVLREANNRPVAVLNHNRAAFYMIELRLFEAMMEELSASLHARGTGGVAPAGRLRSSTPQEVACKKT